jgi:putative nucleotidyltransferase with HDIG domain
MGKSRRSPRRDFDITVQGEVREDIDLELLFRVALDVAARERAKAEGERTEAPEQPRHTTGVPGGVTEAARGLSEHLVAPLGRRWWHVQAVANRAEQLADAVRRDERDLLVASAWLHDIGYAEELAVTGLHALDGARYLQDHGWPEPIVSLVAHHTGADEEARQRGLAGSLAAFKKPPPALLDALTAADMVTGPDGSWVRAEDRVVEILRRYDPDHPVHRAVTQSRSALLFAVKRVQGRARRPIQPAPKPP